MKTKMIQYCISIGWNYSELLAFLKVSRDKEIEIVNSKKDKKMKYQEQEYFCSKCNRIHKKYYNHQVAKIYKNHYHFRESVSKTESFRRDFKAKWNRESNKPKDITCKPNFIN